MFNGWILLCALVSLIKDGKGSVYESAGVGIDIIHIELSDILTRSELFTIAFRAF